MSNKKRGSIKKIIRVIEQRYQRNELLRRLTAKQIFKTKLRLYAKEVLQLNACLTFVVKSKYFKINERWEVNVVYKFCSEFREELKDRAIYMVFYLKKTTDLIDF